MFFKVVSKIWRYVAFFIRAKKIWGLPRQSDVLIYDATSHEITLEYLKPWNPEVLHVRGEQIYLRLFFLSLFRCGARLNAYADCFIEKVCPRLMVTFIDNNPRFYTISQRHPGVKTLLIQNGWRTQHPGWGVFEEMDRGNFFIDYMLLFGSVGAEKYAQYITGNIVLMGSIKNNYIRKEKLSERGVMAFVSSWTPAGYILGGVFTEAEDFNEKIDRPIIQCLVRYAEENRKKLVFIPRNCRDNELRAKEEAYFRELLGCDPEFLEPKEPYPGYSSVDYAEVVVTSDSTLGYESIARGNKTAIFSFRSKFCKSWEGDFGWPREFQGEGPFWTMNPEPDSFVRILDYLFEIDNVQWCKDIEAVNFSSYMVYNPGNTILRSTFENILEAPPAQVL
jgi:surface carbohydrate biosynthesis protein